MEGVTEEELKNMEKKIMEENKAKEEALKKEIEEKLKKEAEAKKKEEEEALAKTELENKAKALEEEKAKLEEMIKLQAEQKEKEIAELKSQMGESKQIKTPFTDNGKETFDVSKLDMTESDELSKKAFFDHIAKNKR